MAKQGLRNTVCCKLSDLELERLDALAKIWGRNRSGVLRALVNGTGHIGATTFADGEDPLRRKP